MGLLNTHFEAASEGLDGFVRTGAGLIVKPNTVTPFETEFTVNGITPKVGVRTGDLVLCEVIHREQKPKTGNQAIGDDELATTGWDDPRVMHVIEVVIACPGFTLGEIGDDGEFEALADPLSEAFSKQTPTLFGQHLRALPGEVTRLHQFLTQRGWRPVDLGNQQQFEPTPEDRQRMIWHIGVGLEPHMEGRTNAYGQIMQFRAQHGPRLDQVELRAAGEQQRETGFVDFMVAHQRKVLAAQASLLDTATEAQRDNRLRFIASVAGTRFVTKEDGGIDPKRSNTYLENQRRGQTYDDNSHGRTFPTRANVPGFTVEGEPFSFWEVANDPNKGQGGEAVKAQVGTGDEPEQPWDAKG